MSGRGEHAVVDRWQTGGFHVERHLRCRCGWTATHYNAGHLTELYRAHKAGVSCPT